jgi:transcriptional regulator with XRE-family HTH domain
MWVKYMSLSSLGKTVRAARLAHHLSQEQAAKLSGVSRVTLNQLENGTLEEIGYSKLIAILALLELDLETKPEPGPKNGLVVAARSASTSYRDILSADQLASILRSGKTPREYEPHLMAFLEEVPKPVVLKAVAEAATPSVPIRTIFKHLEGWCAQWKIQEATWA